MMRKLFWLGVTLSLCWLPAVHAADPDLFENREAGFSLRKPSGWHFLPSSVVAENLALPRLKEKELEKVIRSKPNLPLLVLARYQEPHDGLNPSVQVAFKTQGELTGKGPRALLERVVERLQTHFSDFSFVEEVTETTVDGEPAARMAAKYTVIDPKGNEMKTFARMWVIPRGEYMLTVSMYGPQEGPDFSGKEFESIFHSIKLTKP